MMDTTIYIAAFSTRHHPREHHTLLVNVSWFATMLAGAMVAVAGLTALTYHLS